ncbi:MAG: Crp/Fnr family transcriptional regulator [Bacteroidales bacterium]
MNIKCDCEKCELRSAFFESFREDELESFCRNKQETFHHRGDIVFHEGDEVKSFSYLKSGLLKLFKTMPNGKDQIITIAGPFDFVSLLGVFTISHQTYSVSALEDSVICHIDIQEIKHIVRNNGLFSLNLMERIGSISNKIIQESMEFRRRNTLGKVAYILLKMSRDVYMNQTFNLPVSRREIAEYTGMTTENVIRTMSEFRKEKIIRINGREIEIMDMESLDRISNFG